MQSLVNGGLPAAAPAPRLPAPPDDLAAALLRLADEDADAYADRLHDGVLQALVVARYAADAASRGGDPSWTRDAVQDALVALRRAVWLLRPRATDGLQAALTDLSRQRTAAGQPAALLHLDPEVVAALAAEAAAVAYRFVQAVLDEAGARAVHVRLTRSGGLAALDVDAVVRNPAAWSLRARALGGGLVVGEGRLRLLLPLPETAAPEDQDLRCENTLPDNRKAAS